MSSLVVSLRQGDEAIGEDGGGVHESQHGEVEIHEGILCRVPSRLSLVLQIGDEARVQGPTDLPETVLRQEPLGHRRVIPRRQGILRRGLDERAQGLHVVDDLQVQRFSAPIDYGTLAIHFLSAYAR